MPTGSGCWRFIRCGCRLGHGGGLCNTWWDWVKQWSNYFTLSDRTSFLHHFCSVFNCILQSTRSIDWRLMRQIWGSSCTWQPRESWWSLLKPFWRNSTWSVCAIGMGFGNVLHSFDTKSAPRISRKSFDLESSNFIGTCIPTLSTASTSNHRSDGRVFLCSERWR